MTGQPDWQSHAKQLLADIAATVDADERYELLVTLCGVIQQQFGELSEQEVWEYVQGLLALLATKAKEPQAAGRFTEAHLNASAKRWEAANPPHLTYPPGYVGRSLGQAESRRPRSREARPRRRRTAVGSRDRPRPSADDDSDPEPVDPRQRGAPECPRCRSAINVRRVSWVRGWSCRWCAAENWRRDLEEQLRRLHQELDRITKAGS